MKKNLRVNISGLIFNIDDDAYKALQNYLDRLKHHFGSSESSKEIISDIESRIAEMFQAKSGTAENIIDLSTVKEVIKAMGEPSEIDGEEEDINEQSAHHNTENKESYANYNTSYTDYKETKRRLYRDPDNKIVGGVSSGLAAYFNIDPIWVRLAFVLLTFSGMSILVYIILWIAIPEARTTAQRLEMRGEPINLENIERTINEEFNDISNRFKNMKEKHFSKKKDELTIFEKIAHLFVRIIGGIIKVIGSFIGIILAFVAFILIMALIPGFFTTSFFLFDGFNFLPFTSALGSITNNPADINLTLTALAMVLFIPLIAIVYGGIKLIFGIRNQNSVIGISLLSIWIIGVILLVYTGTKFGNSFHRKANINQEVYFDKTQSDTLFVNLVDIDSIYPDFPLIHSDRKQYLLCSDDENYYINPNFKTRLLDSDESFSMEIKRIARGRNKRAARYNAENINYSYTITDSLLELPAYCYWDKDNNFRAQHIEITFGIPKGKVLKFNKNIEDSLDEWGNFDANKLNAIGIKKGKKLIFIDDYNDHIIIQSEEKRLEIHDDDIDIIDL